MKKRILSLIVAVCMLFSFVAWSVASVTEEKASDYPYILVHGMMGWGDDSTVNQESSYWGYGSEIEDGVSVIVKYFRDKGLEAYAPSVSPLGSAWDRACELYAKLTGTRVDYGEAHSKAAGHARYGRDYTGQALMGEAWDFTSEKLNLISHSFGGPTIHVFTSLMAYGAAEEVAASGDDCSPLFTGGHADSVYSVSTLCSPHNGSPIADLLYYTKVPVLAFAVMMNIEGTKENPETDYMFDQWGITGDPSKGETVSFSLAKCMNIAKSSDNCAYDMTLKGSKELNERFKTVDSVYYFSYSCDFTETNSLGMVTMPTESGANILSAASFMCIAGATLKNLGNDWKRNDGLVPVASAVYPSSEEDTHIDYVDGMTVKPGVWYSMPVIQNASHGYHVMSAPEKIDEAYSGIISLLESIK